MKKFAVLFLIFAFTMPAYAEILTAEGRQEHYEKALSKYNEPTKNPFKKVWRKVVLWDAETAVEIDKYVAQKQKEQEEQEMAHAAYLSEHPEARVEEAIDRLNYTIRLNSLENNIHDTLRTPYTYHGYMHPNGAFEITRF